MCAKKPAKATGCAACMQQRARAGQPDDLLADARGAASSRRRSEALGHAPHGPRYGRLPCGDHACRRLRREGMRLPVPPRDLRPDLRARHARHAVLHRVPEARAAAAASSSAAARSGSRRSRACWPATATSRSSRPRPGPSSRSSPREGSIAWERRDVRRRRGPRGRLHGHRLHRRHRRQHPASTRTPSAARCSSTSSTCRRCATSSSRRSCAPARWRSRSRPPAPRPRWPSA